MSDRHDRQAALVAAHRRLKQRGIVHTGDNATTLPDTPRRQRALQTCHRPTDRQRARQPLPRDNGAYVPELAAQLENDPNLTDGARRCARKLAEETYRRNREGRSLAVTVSYLARALGRCRRTVQRYLRQLERAGYIVVDVIAGVRSRMCIGLVVRLTGQMIARHHREKWPDNARNPGATLESQKHRFKGYIKGISREIPVKQWAVRCMDGVFRSFMKTKPLENLPAIVPA